MCGAANCRGTLAPKKQEEEITEDVRKKIDCRGLRDEREQQKNDRLRLRRNGDRI